MSVCKLLEDFGRISTVPISLDAIVAELRQRGVTDEIHYVCDEALDPRILRGYLYRTEKLVEGKVHYSSTVVHAKMTDGEVRLVCAKELIHILDPDNSRVADRSRLNDLLKKIVLPPEFAEMVDESDHVSTDRDALVEAMMLLFPLAARETIYANYVNGKVSLEWIADKAELHIDHVSPVLNGYWPKIAQSLIEKRRRLEAEREEVVPFRKSRVHQG